MRKQFAAFSVFREKDSHIRLSFFNEEKGRSMVKRIRLSELAYSSGKSAEINIFSEVSSIS